MLAYERIQWSYRPRQLPTDATIPGASPAEAAQLNRITGSIVNAALTVHKRLGPGLLETVYEACLAHELGNAGLDVRRQVPVAVTYDNLRFRAAYRLDLLVDRKVVVELKATEKFVPVHRAQLLTYMRLAKKRVGLLLTFNTTLLKEGFVRLVL